MRTIQIQLPSFAALAILVFTGSATPQDKSPDLLNALEVQRLVKRAEPGDNARLAAHFAALANRYVGEAKRHTSMSQNFGSNPSRNLWTGMSAQSKRLADLNTQSASELRELAAYHQKLASGGSLTPPVGGARFEEGVPAPAGQELNVIAAKASTPADHHLFEEYFLILAERYIADAKDQVTTGNGYRGTHVTQAARHCDRLVDLLRDAAKEATEAAAMHKELARALR